MFQRRENEPDYALLNDPESKTVNRYGKGIELTQAGATLHGKSLHINSDDAIGDNPNRYKQHGFYFTADNCIACHACESACSEKNDNPPHLAFRSVGYVEGGSYPATQRLNISMACNHCDNPVCLKGCPTRAYTKFSEYGAVLQDPDICFGCGYCTWVCPYNAPQLDPVKGQVTKCNMCVDRLEVGLKPACVSACLGKALDFGVIENTPEGREQSKTEIPGFPRTDITHPNIRFQQTRTTQREMSRLDNTPLKYHRDDNDGQFHPKLDPKQGFQRSWNLKKLLGSHENAHITFTLTIQMVMGAFLLLTLGRWGMVEPLLSFTQSDVILPTLLLLVATAGVGLFKLNMHLGKPHRFYRGFYNLKYSPVSREIAGVSLFFVGLVGFTLTVLATPILPEPLSLLLNELFTILALSGTAIGGYFMYKLYRIPARPFWDHWHTAATFTGTGLALGALLLIWLLREPSTLLSYVLGAGIVIEGIGLLFHAHNLHDSQSEASASFYQQHTTYGYPYWIRNGLLLLSLPLLGAMLFFNHFSVTVLTVLTAMILLSAIIGRALFYVVVIPTTMPGAFFWRNRGFVEHALDSGLSSMPQLGVEAPRHHPFRIGELIAEAKAVLSSR